MKTSTSNSDYVDIKGIRSIAARGYVRTKFIRPVVELRLSTRKLLLSNTASSLPLSNTIVIRFRELALTCLKQVTLWLVTVKILPLYIILENNKIQREYRVKKNVFNN